MIRRLIATPEEEWERGAPRTWLCLHGNPAWSYLYRKMIPVLVAGGYRVVKMEVLFYELCSDTELISLIKEGRRMVGPEITMAVDFGYRWRHWHDAKYVIDRIADKKVVKAKALLAGLLSRAGVAVTPPKENNPRFPVPVHRDNVFNQPTDVAWDSQGNIYITDGYINSRVAKYDKNGDWVKSFGEPGTGPGQFRTPHAIAIDKNDNVYVGDRGNQRVQIFDTNGKYLREWKIEIPPDYNTRAVNGETPKAPSMQGVGAPNSLCITPGPNQVLFLGESTWPARIFKVTLDGKVLGVIGKSGRNLKQFSGGHALACPSENEIYVAESSNWRVQKLILHPTPAQMSTAGR